MKQYSLQYLQMCHSSPELQAEKLRGSKPDFDFLDHVAVSVRKTADMEKIYSETGTAYYRDFKAFIPKQALKYMGAEKWYSAKHIYFWVPTLDQLSDKFSRLVRSIQQKRKKDYEAWYDYVLLETFIRERPDYIKKMKSLDEVILSVYMLYRYERTYEAQTGQWV